MLRTEDISAGAPRQKVRRLAKAVLTHPVAARLGAPLRSAWWRIRGLGTHNPPVRREVTSILFVCLGNICRSPFGAALASRLSADAGRRDIRCSSAGIRPSQDDCSPPEACRASERYGVALTGHRPQALTPELMRSHDLVVVMEWRQLAQLRDMYPDLRSRIFLLPLFDDAAQGGYERYNIADPFGKPLVAFDECYRRMERSLRRFVAALQH